MPEKYLVPNFKNKTQHYSKEVLKYGNNGWLEAIAAIIGIGAGIATIVEVFAPRCPTCGSKLVIVNNYYYCKKCLIYTNPRTG